MNEQAEGMTPNPENLNIEELRTREKTEPGIMQRAVLRAQAAAAGKVIPDRDLHGNANTEAALNEDTERRQKEIARLRANRSVGRVVLDALSDMIHGRLFPESLQAKTRHMWQGDPLPSQPVVPPEMQRTQSMPKNTGLNK